MRSMINVANTERGFSLLARIGVQQLCLFKARQYPLYMRVWLDCQLQSRPQLHNSFRLQTVESAQQLSLSKYTAQHFCRHV